MLPIALTAYLVLFILVGVLFLFVSLLIGRFIRPRAPSVAKGEAYECGEPAVGSAFIQFDLRFYVVALLFIIFEVELAFFFPPAVVFGKVNQLRGANFGPIVQRDESSLTAMPIRLPPADEKRPEKTRVQDTVISPPLQLTPAAKEKFNELGIPAASVERMERDSLASGFWETDLSGHLQVDLKSLAFMALLDIGVFFVVLLVGFAFLWKQGDLNWVRAISRPAGEEEIKLAVLPRTGVGS